MSPSSSAKEWAAVAGTFDPSLLRLPGLAEAFDHLLEILGVLVRQHLPAMFYRIGRIDAQRLPPRLARLFELTHLAISGGEPHARGVGVRVAQDAAFQQRGGLRIATQLIQRLRLSLHVHIREEWIERQRA